MIVDLETAIARLCAAAGPAAAATVPLEEAGGRVTAAAVTAPLAMPPWPAAKVDGYAVAWHQWQRRYQVVGQLEAGAAPPDLSEGQALRVFTGAALPPAASVVIKAEDAQWENGELLVKAMPRVRHIAAPGSRIRPGAVIVEDGEVLDAVRLELLSSLGVAAVEVYEPPRVGVLVSGNELQTPGAELRPCEIYNSNRVMHSHLLRDAGAVPVLPPEWTVPDDAGAQQAAIEALASDCRLIILCGGSGRGGKDLSHAVLDALGTEKLFNGLDLKPGHGSSAVRKGPCLIVNLPGPPPAGHLLFHALLQPLLRRLRGQRDHQHHWFELPLHDAERPQPQRSLRSARLLQIDGALQAGSAASATPTLGRLLLDLPPHTGAPGDIVRALLV